MIQRIILGFLEKERNQPQVRWMRPIEKESSLKKPKEQQ